MGKMEILQEWLDKANNDLRAAEYLSTMHHPTPDEIICFHCQQSTEKHLKAFIFYQDIEPEKTHELEELYLKCMEYNTSFSSLLLKLQFLNKYAVMPRYPNELKITNEDMKTAITYAKSIQEFVLNILNNSEP